MRLVHVKVILSAGILSQGNECVCHLVMAVVEETVITSSQLRNAMMPVLLLGVSIKPSCHCYVVSSGVPRNFFSGGVQQIQLRTERTEIWGR